MQRLSWPNPLFNGLIVSLSLFFFKLLYIININPLSDLELAEIPFQINITKSQIATQHCSS